MMLDVEFKSISSTVISYLPIGMTIGVIVLAELMLALFTWKRDYSVTDNLSITADKQYSNTEIIGLVLYTDNILFFQLAGLILLASMIGAIVLTVNHRPSAKRQDINKQVERDAESSIKNIDMKPGSGDMIAINNYLALASILFVIGIFGVFLNKKYNYHPDVD